jgi:hypothetical protein
MNENLKEMLKVAEGRHLSTEESKLFRNYYEELPKRLELMRLLEKKEKALVNQALNAFFAEYPGLNSASDTRANAERDMTYLYRAATNAMVQQDYLSLAQKADYIFAIFANLGFPTGAMESAYNQLRKQLQSEVDSKTWECIGPFFQVLSEQRLAYWHELEKKMPLLIQKGVDYVFNSWPQLKNLPDVETHLKKDMQTLLKTVGLSMLSQSADPVNEKKAWLYAYFRNLRFDMQMVFQTYRNLPQLSQELLSEQTLQALKPWLQILETDV